MRIQSFRVWFSSALAQGRGAVRRAGIAITRKARAALGRLAVDDVEEEDPLSGRQGARAWLSALEATVEKLKRLFDESRFERLSRLESYFRRLVGLPPRIKNAPRASVPPATPTRRASQGAGPRPPATSQETQQMQAQIRSGMVQANLRGSERPRAATGSKAPESDPGPDNHS